jgi:hypothetical protein
MNAGIDYSHGQSNFNPKTGIHFGVISQGSIMMEALIDFESIYPDPECPECNSAIDADCETCPVCGAEIEMDYMDIEPIGLEYNREGYKITDCLDTDLMILDSPYYTFAQYCSPCVPGAGNLDSPTDNGVKCYCLGHDWFDNGVAPYSVYDVKTEKLVEAGK